MHTNLTATECHHPDSVDFLVVTALPEERDAVLHRLGEFEPVRIGELPIYYLCTLPTSNGSYEIALTLLSQMGNVEAGIHTTQAINELNPSCVLMIGIAAGVKGKVDLGDVVVSTQIIYYEQAKRTPKGLQCRPLSIASDHLLLHSAQNYTDGSWCDPIAVDRPQQRRETCCSPRVHFGPLAVGDEVVADERRVAELLGLHPKIVGIEMESYGVAAAAAASAARPRFLAIRGISDFADEQKDDGFRQCAATAAATFAVGFLRSRPVSLNGPSASANGAPRKQPGPVIAIRHLSMQHIPSQSVIDSLPSRLSRSSVTELLVDQTDLYAEGRLSDPLGAAKRQADLECVVDGLLKSQPDAIVAYFGIAHIPLAFYLGFRLSNKRRLRFFELNRYTRRWEHLHGEEEGPELKVDGLPTHPTDDRGDILVRISISDPVRAEEITEIVPSPIASLHLCIEPPKRDVLVSERQLRDYGAKFRRMLDSIHQLLPNRERVHVFYAGPVSLAVYFGQLISQTIDRRIVVYNYTVKDQPRYSWGLEVTGELGSPDFLVEPQRQD